MTTPSPNAGFALRLLGGFELRDAAGTPVLAAGKPLAVLAYLACARSQRASRQALIGMLWGDADPERGRASLRQALFSVRHRLGIDLIQTDGEWLQLSADVALDVREFLEAVEQGNNTLAISRYSGDFIPDFAAPGAGDFEAWIDTERRRLRGAYLAAARSHLRQVMARGDAAAAVNLSASLRDADPEDDEHWRLRFEALALAGRFVVIDLEEADLRAARSEDGRPVDAATEALLRRLRRAAGDSSATAEAVPSSRIPADPEFQGRADVFAQVLSVWGLAARGRAQRRALVASAGLGKTRMLRELGRRLSSQRARVVHVFARQGERDDAFGFLAELVSRVAELSGASGVAPASAAVLAGLVPVLADIFHVKPEAGVSDAAELLRRRTLAFADLLGAVADDRPLALLADDMQWADQASVVAIDRAFARMPTVPLLLLAASRTDVPNLCAAEERMALPPLGRDEVALLISSIAATEAPGWSEELTSRIHAAAGGSPFAVLQFLRLAMERGVIHVIGDRWHVPDAVAVQPLLDRSAAVAWRLRLLAEEDLGALTCLAMADSALSEEVLADAAGTSRETLRDSLFRLEADAFAAHSAGDHWRVAHDLVAEGTLAITTPAQRLRCAERLATALGRLAAPSDVLAARHVVRLHLDAERPDAALQFVREWVGRHPRDARLSADLASTLMGGRSHPALEAQVRAVLARRRRWWTSRLTVAGASVFATLGLAAFLLLRPAGLVLTSSPSPTETDRNLIVYEVSPRIELRNSINRVSTWRDGDTVRMAPADVDAPLLGRPWAVLHRGVAVFDSVYPSIHGDKAIAAVQDVRFALAGIQPLVLRRVNRGDSLAVEMATINGQPLDETMPTVRVAAGAPIRGTVRVRYTTRGRDVLYVMAQAASWGRGERDTVTVRSLLAGVSGASFVFPVNLTAPSAPGDYWILWTHGTEPSASWLLSGTNWACKKAVFNDGNDLATMPDSVLEAGVRRGIITVSTMICDETGPRGDRYLPLAGIRVIVR